MNARKDVLPNEFINAVMILLVKDVAENGT
jgi:hypothetical protein